jgi:hypothetical protein
VFEWWYGRSFLWANRYIDLRVQGNLWYGFLKLQLSNKKEKDILHFSDMQVSDKKFVYIYS